MTPAEQANRPCWTGQGFEIWFFVVLVPDSERALWIRMTRFAHGEEQDVRVWAALSERGRVHQQRERLPLGALREEQGDGGEAPCLRVGEGVHFQGGESAGSCGDVRWAIEFEAGPEAVQRMPKLPGFVPVGTHATHPYAEAATTGFAEVDGRRVSLDGGLLTQMHIWGHERVEWLRWAWVPRFDDGSALELTAVAPKDGGSQLVALWARLGPPAGGGGEVGEILDLTGLTKAARAKLEAPRPGVLHHVANASGRRVVLRVFGRPETFAGWDYRQTTAAGGDLHVAQTNQAQAELEVYQRAGLGWRPVHRTRSTCAALEFHGVPDFSEFRYVPWDASGPGPGEVEGEGEGEVEGGQEPAVALAAGSDNALGETLGEGRWLALERPPRIVALGLTYRAHARETASAMDPVIFEIDPAAWEGLEGEGAPAVLSRPSSARLLAAGARLDPGVPQLLGAFGFLPAMLDYEVELGLVFPEGLSRLEELESEAGGGAGGRVGLFVANDVSARSLQILGEGQGERLAYWGAAKSLPGFAPTSARAWLPQRFSLEAWPALTLETRVNGALRQQAALSLLAESPRQMLTRVLGEVGQLPPGTMLLTGTPAGVAFTVPRWKRVVGERLLDRAGKLRAAVGSFCGSSRFLRPGDRVEVSAGPLGGFAHVVAIEPEPKS